MRHLLDTHVLLWSLHRPERLDAAIRDLLEDAEQDVFFSAASIWEIAIKASLGRADFMVRPEIIAREALLTGFQELVVSAKAASLVVDLPWLHRDPFDRLLVAQAIAGSLKLYTADPKLPAYSDAVQLVS